MKEAERLHVRRTARVQNIMSDCNRPRSANFRPEWQIGPNAASQSWMWILVAPFLLRSEQVGLPEIFFLKNARGCLLVPVEWFRRLHLGEGSAKTQISVSPRGPLYLSFAIDSQVQTVSIPFVSVKALSSELYGAHEFRALTRLINGGRPYSQLTENTRAGHRPR